MNAALGGRVHEHGRLMFMNTQVREVHKRAGRLRGALRDGPRSWTRKRQR
jgi:uncharacterized lipoprotein YbaY